MAHHKQRNRFNFSVAGPRSEFAQRIDDRFAVRRGGWSAEARGADNGQLVGCGKGLEVAFHRALPGFAIRAVREQNDAPHRRAQVRHPEEESSIRSAGVEKIRETRAGAAVKSELVK